MPGMLFISICCCGVGDACGDGDGDGDGLICIPGILSISIVPGVAVGDGNGVGDGSTSMPFIPSCLGFAVPFFFCGVGLGFGLDISIPFMSWTSRANEAPPLAADPIIIRAITSKQSFAQNRAS